MEKKQDTKRRELMKRATRRLLNTEQKGKEPITPKKKRKEG